MAPAPQLLCIHMLRAVPEVGSALDDALDGTYPSGPCLTSTDVGLVGNAERERNRVCDRTHGYYAVPIQLITGSLQSPGRISS